MLKLSIVLVPLLLGACAQSHELAVPRGPVFGLNAGHWAPTPVDLAPAQSVTP